MELFHTRGIGLVAALKMHGFTPTSVTKDSNGKALWFYQRSATLTQTVEAFYDGSLLVPAHAYNKALFEVKIADVFTEVR